MDVFEDLDQKFPLVGRKAPRDGLASIPEAPEWNLVDAPVRPQLLKELQDPGRAEYIEITAGVLGREVSGILFEEGDGSEIDGLASDDRRPEVAAGDDPVVVRIGRIRVQGRTPPKEASLGRSGLVGSIPRRAMFSRRACGA